MTNCGSGEKYDFAFSNNAHGYGKVVFRVYSKLLLVKLRNTILLKPILDVGNSRAPPVKTNQVAELSL